MNKKAKQDIIVCGIIYLFLAFCFSQTLTMKNGADVMPRMIVLLATVCNTLLLANTFGKLKTPSDKGYTTINEIAVPVLMFLGVVAYAVLTGFTNYFIATAILIAVFMLVEKVRPVWLVCVIDVVYLIFVYVLFVVVLKVPLLH